MKFKLLLILFTFISIMSLASAEQPFYTYSPVGEQVQYGVNYSINVNNSQYLQGYTPTTLKDWIQTQFNSVYCQLTGCTMQGDINMDGNSITNVGNISLPFPDKQVLFMNDGNLYSVSNLTYNFTTGVLSAPTLNATSGTSIYLDTVKFSQETIPLADSFVNTIFVSNLHYFTIGDNLSDAEVGLQSQNLNTAPNSTSYIATINGDGYGNGFNKFSHNFNPYPDWGAFFNNRGRTNFYGYYDNATTMNTSNSGVYFSLASDFLNNSNWSVVGFKDDIDVAYYTKDNFSFFTNAYFNNDVEILGGILNVTGDIVSPGNQNEVIFNNIGKLDTDNNFTYNFTTGILTIPTLNVTSNNSIYLSGVKFSEQSLQLGDVPSHTVTIEVADYLTLLGNQTNNSIGLGSRNIDFGEYSNSWVATINADGHGFGFNKFNSNYSNYPEEGDYFNYHGLTRFLGYYNNSMNMTQNNSGVILGLASNFETNQYNSILGFQDKLDVAYYTKDNFSFFTNAYFNNNISVGQKITFGLGAIIENIVDGMIKIIGNVSIEGNLDMNNNSIQNIETLTFDTSYNNGWQIGRMNWNADEGTIEIGTDVEGSVTQLGRELIVKTVNKAGSKLENGEVVYISGAQGNRPAVARAIANSTETSFVLGMVTANNGCEINQECYIATFGTVNDLNTNNYSEGDKLYLSADIPGAVTVIAPEFPNSIVKIGNIVTSHINQGKIELQIGIDYTNGVTFSTIGLLNDIVQTNYKIKSLPGNDAINQNVFTIEMNGTTGIDIPHLILQPGGPEQASIWVRSGIVVPESVTCLNSTNRTDSNCYEEVGNFTWEINDFNTSLSEGADWGITGELEVIKDTDIHGDLIISSLNNTYVNGSAYVCVYNNGTLFASEVACP